jgi:hypothetical protein
MMVVGNCWVDLAVVRERRRLAEINVWKGLFTDIISNCGKLV